MNAKGCGDKRIKPQSITRNRTGMARTYYLFLCIRIAAAIKTKCCDCRKYPVTLQLEYSPPSRSQS